MDSPKNCNECKKTKFCKSWYGGSMCNATKDARNKIIEEVKRK